MDLKAKHSENLRFRPYQCRSISFQLTFRIMWYRLVTCCTGLLSAVFWCVNDVVEGIQYLLGTQRVWSRFGDQVQTGRGNILENSKLLQQGCSHHGHALAECSSRLPPLGPIQNLEKITIVSAIVCCGKRSKMPTA